MKRSTKKINAALAMGAVLLAGACSGGTEMGPSPSEDPAAPNEDPAAPNDETSEGVTIADDGSVTFHEEVTIRVNDMPTQDRAEDRAFWNRSVELLNEQWPEITIEGIESAYEPQAFQAQITAGNLPVQMVVPFTEPRGLGENDQIADLRPTLEALGLLDQLNPDLLRNVDVDGKIVGIPYQAYSQGLSYNRDLMEQAGLDPDAPPTTWDELKVAAKAIKDETGETGFGFPTTGNYGGWMFTTMCYTFGGTIQNEDGSEMTVNNPGCEKALDTLMEMRWDDESMSANAVYPDEQLYQDFGAGRVGFVISDPGAAYWGAVLDNGMPAEHLGAGALPQDGGEHGSLGGGAVSIVSPKASEAERVAAVLWTKTYYLDRYLDEEVASAAAKAQADAGLPVGIPELFPLNDDRQEAYFEWIAPYINVIPEHFAPYRDSPVTGIVLAEPPNSTQEVYAELDAVLQNVLSNRDADPGQILEETAEAIQARLER